MSIATWKEHDETGVLTPYAYEKDELVEAVWAPQPGSQEAFLACPIYECLYEGNRGPGKTDALLMDFAQHVNCGYGAEWKGVLFRQSYPELQDVIEKARKWFKRFWPSADFNEGKSFWRFPSGELLYFRFMEKEKDYWHYHGHAYPWIAFEELTTWPDDSCYRIMMSCSRSTLPNMPRKYRATCNPYGVGHNWVKRRWRLPIQLGTICGPVISDSRDKDGELEPERVAIHGELAENKILLHGDPKYITRIRAAAKNPNQLRAWVYGAWDITAGGIIDDLWDEKYHVLPNFPFHLIPRGWIINRAYDHGSSKPFSVGWWVESNGEPIRWNGYVIGSIPGDLIRIHEWYGWNGEDNTGLLMAPSDIAEGIIDREKDWELTGRVQRGPADTNIFDEYEKNKSINGEMNKKGVYWDKADKGPGSRIQGWTLLRTRLKNSLPDLQGLREEAGIFVCARCEQFIRTVPVLPRSDKHIDDVNTDAEDHIGDETRYRLRWKRTMIDQGDF